MSKEILDGYTLVLNRNKYLTSEVEKYVKLYEKTKQENNQLKEKVQYLKDKIENKDRWNQLIADIGYDYDGYRDAENLKALIDELVQYSLYARDDYDIEGWLREGNNE